MLSDKHRSILQIMRIGGAFLCVQPRSKQYLLVPHDTKTQVTQAIAETFDSLGYLQTKPLNAWQLAVVRQLGLKVTHGLFYKSPNDKLCIRKRGLRMDRKRQTK